MPLDHNNDTVVDWWCNPLFFYLGVLGLLAFLVIVLGIVNIYIWHSQKRLRKKKRLMKNNQSNQSLERGKKVRAKTRSNVIFGAMKVMKIKHAQSERSPVRI